MVAIIRNTFQRSIALLHYRELIYSLAVKDLKVRYKSAFLGFLWALIVPVAMMFVFLLIFSFFFKKRNITASYLLAALFPWNFFSTSVTSCTASLVNNGQIIKKVYFPREIIPLSIIASNLFNFILTLGILFIISLFTPHRLGLQLILLPYVIFLQVLLAVGISLLTSALFVFFRDIKYLVEIILLVWFYLTPIFYDQQIIRAKSEFLFQLYLLNPLTGLVVMYRDIFLHGIISSPELILFSSCLIIAIFLTGHTIFMKFEKRFADFV